MKIIHIAIPTIIACLTSGCVSTYYNVKDEPRQKVRFISTEAAQTFYDAMLSENSPRGNGILSFGVAVPYRREILSTHNVRFNSAIQSADSNGDRMISEKEARAYAARVLTPKLAEGRKGS